MSDEVIIDAALVRRLVERQFPGWASLPVEPVRPGGWDNRTLRLGEAMCVRLPSAEAYASQVEKEHRWLPSLAPLLPLTIPTPLAMGKPALGYPWSWSIYAWMEGEPAAAAHIPDLPGFATDLAGFLTALQRIDTSSGPAPGAHNFHRGGPLATYDAEARQAVAALGKQIDAEAVIAMWDAALAAPWRGAPVWLHGDVSPGNLLVRAGRLSAVIDFGCCGVGDPACDLAIAWTFFEGESRAAFKAAVPLDAGAWLRGRAWALWKALIVWSGLPGANPADADKSRRIVDDLLVEHRRAGD